MNGDSIARLSAASVPAAFVLCQPAAAQDGSAMEGGTALYALIAAGALAIVLAMVITRLRSLLASERAGRQAESEALGKQRAEEIAELERLRAEQAILRDKIDSLGRERDGYRRLCNATPFAVWRRDGSGSIIWRNQALDRIIGPEAENDEIASHTDLDRPIQLVEKARAEGATVTEERRFVVDGQRRTFEIYETPAMDDGTSAGFAIDVSRLEGMRAEIRRQVSASNEAFEHLTGAVAIYDRERKLIFCNRAFRSVWGLDEAFTNGEPTIGEVLDRLKEMRRLPEQVEYRQFRKSREALFNALLDPIEELYQRPDERMIRETITRHGLGGLMFLYEDATDRLVMERSLNTFIAVQRATLDNLYEAVAVFGPDGRMSLSNTPYRRMWGLTEEVAEARPHVREVVDRVLDSLGRPPEFVQRRDALIASATEPLSARGRLELPDGRIIDVATLTLPDAQKLFTYLDVTDSMQIERALRERNEALVAGDMVKSEFLENMSYELRTPLNTILGFGEILQNAYFGELNERQLEYVSGILEASEQFLSMINDMLDLASIQAGHMQLEPRMIDVRDLMEEAKEEYADRAGRRRISFALDAPDNLPQFEGDRRRVLQIIGNLLSNAVKFTPPGGSILLGAAGVEGGVDIWIRDNGIGIAEEEQERVFETFRTSERHTRRGTGLGLALVQNLMELHGGSVELESAVGEGTLVTCHFRLSGSVPDDPPPIGVDGVPVEAAET